MRITPHLHAGLPIIVSDLDEMAGIADRYECGWRVNNAASSIAAVVARIEPAQVEARRGGAQKATNELTWKREVTKLISIYDNLQ